MGADRSWATWLLGTAVAFGVLEGRALRTRIAEKPSGTLTATLRRWIGVDPRSARRWMLAPLFGAFLTWLFGHILLGWKP